MSPIKILSTKKIKRNFLDEKIFNLKDYDFLKIKISKKDIQLKNIKKYTFILTSKYSFFYFKEKIYNKIEKKDIKLISTWPKTSSLIEKFWIKVLYSWKDSKEIINFILNKNIGNLLYLTSNQRLDFIEKSIEKEKIKIIEVYKKEKIYLKINENYDCIIFFSPSWVDAFLEKNKIDDKKNIFCIWKTTFNRIKEKGLKNNIYISKQSSEKSILKEINNYYTNER